jgi:uncharacterized protein YdeI (YjbR/CyaY-like superfamily)
LPEVLFWVKLSENLREKSSFLLSVKTSNDRFFNDILSLNCSFEALTPGRQRAYIFYFSQAKQAKTRETRIENCIPKILMGKGLNDL